MKRYFIIGLSVLAAAAVCALLAGCGGDKPEPKAQGGPHTVPWDPGKSAANDPGDGPGEDPEDGYRSDRSDPDAPKTIESKQIILVDCWFSTMDDAEPGVLGNHIYRLWAKLENGAVKGTYEVRDTGEKIDFRASHTLLNRVRELADKYEVAELNGRHVEVKGLPGDFGADIEIQYASREAILADDNSENFLPRGFCEELAALFADAAKTQLPDAGEAE